MSHALPHLLFLDVIARICCEQHKTWSSAWYNFLHSPSPSSVLSTNTFLTTLFSNTFSLCSSLNMTDQVSHPCKTTGKTIVLCVFNRYVTPQYVFYNFMHISTASSGFFFLAVRTLSPTLPVYTRDVYYEVSVHSVSSFDNKLDISAIYRRHYGYKNTAALTGSILFHSTDKIIHFPLFTFFGTRRH